MVAHTADRAVFHLNIEMLYHNVDETQTEGDVYGDVYARDDWHQ
jgi:hypothetical protein